MGIVKPDGVIDVRRVAHKLGIAAPLILDELLQQGRAAALQQVIIGAAHSGVPMVRESEIQYGRLFRHPGKIICVGLNYAAHAREIGVPPPSVPPLFNKYDNALAAHKSIIKLPPRDVSYKFDYETELLIVIGKAARNISQETALDCVAGYCTAHDLSARDLQLELPSAQWMAGKTLDGFGPIGPYFVTSDLAGDPNAMVIETKVNGEVRQSSNTSDFIHNTQAMVSYISKLWTLEPGDIIFTGTPQGVILGKPKDKQVWLKAGDQISSRVGDLGELHVTLA